MFKIKSYKIDKLQYRDPIVFFEKFYKNIYNSLLVSDDFIISGVAPYMIIKYEKNQIYVEFQDRKLEITEDWDIFIKKILEHLDFNVFPLSKIGLIGYLSYDLKDKIENLQVDNLNNYEMPLFEFALYNRYYVFSNTERILYKIELEFQKNSNIDKMIKFENSINATDFIFENNKEEYLRKVKKIKNYIHEGDIYEANFTQQVKARFTGNPYLLFKKLYKVNPAPYSAYLNFSSIIVSNSPELFLFVENNKVKTKPIKGTIRRGNTLKQDKINRRTLETSLKDRAELNMIIDLLRNDISKVCKYNSVKVKSKGHIETYENVFHLVGEVEGNLKSDMVDLIKATFPGGSITGCPKIRAMEIIAETEKFKRNLYTGSILVINKNNLISNIVIRSIIIQDDYLYFNAGGAITLDSVPEMEYEEFVAKISTILKVLDYDNVL